MYITQQVYIKKIFFGSTIKYGEVEEKGGQVQK